MRLLSDSFLVSRSVTLICCRLWKESQRGAKKLRTAAVAALGAVLRIRAPRTAALYDDMRATLAPLLTVAPEHTGTKHEQR